MLKRNKVFTINNGGTSGGAGGATFYGSGGAGHPADESPPYGAPGYMTEPEPQLEDAIGNTVRSMAAERLPAMPSYVQHAEDVDDIGRLTSEAMVKSYEASAQKLEEMGETLKSEMVDCRKTTLQMIQECERIEKETEDAVAQCKAAAEVYRSQAAEVFNQIQRRARIAATARKTCDLLIEEIKDS